MFVLFDLGFYWFVDWCWVDEYMSFNVWMEDGLIDVWGIDGLGKWIVRNDNGWIWEWMDWEVDGWIGWMYGID